jgi:hypothetical protein
VSQVAELSAGAAALSASAEDPSAADKTTADNDKTGAEAAAARERRRIIRTLRKAFRRADSDGNGVLDVPEVSSSSTSSSDCKC